MALGLKNNILNQKGTPAFYSDVFANRPTFGYAGRVFISTDTGAIYEDTGSAWTLIADAGAGTTGTLQQVTTNGNTTSAGIIITAGGLSANSLSNSSFTTGSVLFADGSGTITQKNTNLFWDNTNNRLGIGNASPGAPLDIHGTGTNAQFNGTGTNNAYLQFQNAGVSKWRIGNTYNAGTNSFDIYDSVNALTILSIFNNQSFTFFGANSSQLSFSNGKTASTRTSAAINLTFSAENRQTPAVNVGSSYGFYGGTNGTDPIAEMYGAWEGSSVNNSFWSLYTVLSGSKTEKIRVTSTGYFGINTTTPAYYLDVNGTSRITGNTGIGQIPNSSYRLLVQGASTTSADLSIYATDSNQLLTFAVRNDGVIFTGTAARSPYNDQSGAVANLIVTSGGNLQRSIASSQRLKNNIIDWTESGLDTILALKPKTFTYKPEFYSQPNRVFLGLIAEEVAEVSKYLAEYENEDGSGQVENVRYANIVVPLIKAIHEINDKLIKNNIN